MSGSGYVPVPTEPSTDAQDPFGSAAKGPQVGPSSPSAFSLDFYRDYFDVDTHQVIQRLLCGLIPFSKKYSLTASLRPMPDIYGPFWITATLIFSVAISGSIYEYIISKDLSSLSAFNFGRVTVSAAILFFYWVLLPVIITFIVWIRGRNSSSDFNSVVEEPMPKFGSILSELLAIYGYSLAIYIPAVILLIIPISFVQWTLLGIASLISLSVLCSATWSTFKQKRKRLIVGLFALIIVAHVSMIVSISVLYFHHTPITPAPAVGSAGSESQVNLKQEQ
uniref:Protein YIPF n=2 Tax=Mesocestoides corti TaxID=53468 RepID=A0A5K3EP06_MESCO